MKNKLQSEFLFTLFSLLLIVIVVQSIYALHIRPQAEISLRRDYERSRTDPTVLPGRSIYVIVRDYEQETCIILMIWSLTLLGYKTIKLSRDRRLLDADVLHIPEGLRILPQDSREYSNQIARLPEASRELLLPRALTAVLNRFGATRNVQDAAEAARAVCESEASRLDSENAMLRYTAWAIPAIGFIGTVRGIGAALGTAHRAMSGDITGVTEGLGITFNSTFIALLLSIVVMFLLHQLQLAQERFVLDTEGYVDRKLIAHLRNRGGAGPEASVSADSSLSPTHVVYRGQAYPLETEPLVVGLAEGADLRSLKIVGTSAGISPRHCSLLRTEEGAMVVDHSHYGTWLNDEVVDKRAILRAGDRLRVGTPGATLELVAMT